jgi:Family of unknown function (DUF5682)
VNDLAKNIVKAAVKLDRLHVLGIRHHGPGSAASVLAALEKINPSVVLIEGPSDANELIHFAKYEGMKPPLALLTYAQEDPAQSLFYPYAQYSPEWQAMQWALVQKREVRFIDLPSSAKLVARKAEFDKANKETDEKTDENSAEDSAEDSEESAELQDELVQDPLSALAAAAGESDGESWWNSLVEQTSNGVEVFDAIHDAMAALRAQGQWPISPLELAREAHMRLEIAQALEGNSTGAVVVVCGAWHAPSLTISQAKKSDKDIVKEFLTTKLKTIATWVPWTDSRLASGSGYSAGVVSPGWYRHLWSQYTAQQANKTAEFIASHWQAKVAQLMRDEGLPAAPASVIEA